MIEIQHLDAAQIPMSLLLEADPSEACIQRYLNGAYCLAAVVDGEIIGVCVAKLIAENTFEVFNLAVYPAFQQQGIGSQLLSALFPRLKEQGVQSVVLGTGTFGYQLMFYQRLGFRVESVIKDFFLDHYDEPIFELGIQHKDMLRLRVDL
ncbi:GNAT family N-acetyltransferase [Photobacterium halotolerans]|uniref:GNAT family N-acetyltransferase n=1 Tax=Photobacterium halotolerans TaxID=265726 RepID=A0A7X5ASE3_9GAMM|nr:GNAT family N-acetyltransferase [Photobacterium halotolerans]NAW63860.1 GNAT family N-acetyltransferase [Photobacterium halotolerans]